MKNNLKENLNQLTLSLSCASGFAVIVILGDTPFIRLVLCIGDPAKPLLSAWIISGWALFSVSSIRNLIFLLLNFSEDFFSVSLPSLELFRRLKAKQIKMKMIEVIIPMPAIAAIK